MPPETGMPEAALVGWATGEDGNGAQAGPSFERFTMTDLGNAQAFVENFGKQVRFVPPWQAWLVWDGARWRRDALRHVEQMAKLTVERMLLDALRRNDKAGVKHALASHSEPAIRRMLSLAESERAVVTPPAVFDRDPWLLSCANGTVDLRTGDLRRNEQADLITRGTDLPFPGITGMADLRETCPRWLRFLDEVFGNEDLISFVWHAVGYSLTGITNEDVFFILYGDGRNGKTTFIETLQRVFGEHACAASMDTFLRARQDRQIRSDLARLEGIRLVTASESSSGRRLDEATVKTLTGGDTLVARPPYRSEVEFRPRFKLWLRTNHLPRIDPNDDAIWARIRAIPFTECFLGREDAALEETLEAELPGILDWAIMGAVLYHLQGLGSAPAVEQATTEYRQSEDTLGVFIDECCIRERGATVEAGALRAKYVEFCAKAGERPLTAGVLGKALIRKEIEPGRSGSVRFYRGVRLV